MIEAEQPEGLSARKLVVETEKHNVITAYSAKDGLDLLQRFPRVDAVLVHETLVRAEPDLLARVKQTAPGVPIILASPFGDRQHPDAAFVIDSHRPQDVLELFTREFPGSLSN
jgi:DNA-binding NtrC family response regulator